ncbi:hypothetical protein J4466_00390 [Candidatus Pacearchaeota archaeon]|nr:hypothetical protein [Candidatus Pacearchaeota archaeon]
MKISDKKREKITEHILSVLYDQFPKPLFTSQIAHEIARDEEFTKTLIQELEKKGIVIPINKNSKGTKYLRRLRWRLSNKAQEAYSNHTK